MNSRFLTFFLVLSIASIFLLSPFVALGDQASSTNFIIDGAITVGGGNSTSTSFRLPGALNEAGRTTSTSFIIDFGFSSFPIYATPYPTPLTPYPTPSGGGGGVTIGIPPLKPPVPRIPPGTFCDFNSDGKCNMVDLSVLLFYYGQSGADVGRYDLNKNSTVDFADISILLYYWA
ncbi:hypothetical protein HY967_03295 [Candidatus Jorgensenbacteria bacterium]|nr:hypothetical protein [Candidatus Jorgensenbacteria bacterium]